MPHFACFDHHGKSEGYLSSLPKWNWFRHDENQPDKLDLVLTDHAILGRAGQLEDFRQQDTRLFFCYPHAARPNLVNDVVPEWDGITAHFVPAEGHVDVMRAYGYKKPIHVVGWHLCPLRPFSPRKLRRVLFAPIHPRCADVDQFANREAFLQLVDLALRGHIFLTVRYIKSLEESGLERVDHARIEYNPGQLTPCWDAIDNADLVVGHQTFAWLAVARGVPTVKFGTEIPTHLMTEPVQYARHWKAYQPLLAYPLDLLQTDDPLEMLQQSAAGHEAVDAWRHRMIGQPFDSDKFTQILQNYLEGE